MKSCLMKISFPNYIYEFISQRIVVSATEVYKKNRGLFFVYVSGVDLSYHT